MRHVLLCGLLVLASCGGSASSNPAQAGHTLRLAWDAGRFEGAQAGVTALTKVVTSLSGGQVVLEEVTADGNSCGDDERCIDALLAGRVDVYQATIGDLASVFPELQVLDIPYLFEHDGIVANAFAGPFYTHLKTEMAKQKNLELMAVSHGDGWRGIATRMGPVTQPDDVRGLSFATAGSPIQLQVVRALGAEPRVEGDSTASGEAGAAIDGAIVGVLDVDRGGPFPFDHLTLNRHSYGVTLWVMNADSLAALPEDLQQVVRVGFDELRRLSFAFPNDAEAAALDAFAANGGEVYVPTNDERRAFVMASGRVSTWYMDTYGSDWLVWLEETISEAERQVGTAP